MRQTRLTVAALLAAPAAMAFHFCPPTGPLLPLLKQPTSDMFDLVPLDYALNCLIDDPTAAFNTSSTSFSVTISTKDETIFQYHHTAPNINTTGVQQIDGDSVYRIASVSKMFTVLTLMLQEGMDLDDYVWRYVPQLEGLENFKETTLRMIASHISGFPRDGVVFDYKFNVPEENLIGLGLPAAEYPSDYAICNAPGLPNCSQDEFLSGVAEGDLVWSPAQTPAYSNFAFSTLAFAAEDFTGQSWDDIVAKNVIEPLGLKTTGFTPPEAKDMVIPQDADVWPLLNTDNWEGTGGVWSTPNELGQAIRGLLNNKILSKVETAKWLKPQAYTSSPTGGATGMPWQVIRPNNLQRASGPRPLEIYSMSGSIPNYAAYFALIPEYDVGISINVAGTGDDAATRKLLDLSVQHLIPNVDDLVRDQANIFAGTYVDKLSNQSSITLTLDDGPGLKITEWMTRGAPFLDIWTALKDFPNVDARIYAVGQEGRWQVGFQGIPEREETGIFQSACDTWFDFGALRYAGELVDQFTFEIDEAGDVTALKVPGLRETLTKVQEEEKEEEDKEDKEEDK